MANRTRGALPSKPGRDPLEAVIAAAGRYVHPSDDLRPRLIEAAQEHSRRRRGQRRLMAIAGALCGLLILATSAWIGLGTHGFGRITPVAATSRLTLPLKPSCA